MNMGMTNESGPSLPFFRPPLPSTLLILSLQQMADERVFVWGLNVYCQLHCVVWQFKFTSLVIFWG